MLYSIAWKISKIFSIEGSVLSQRKEFRSKLESAIYKISIFPLNISTLVPCLAVACVFARILELATYLLLFDGIWLGSRRYELRPQRSKGQLHYCVRSAFQYRIEIGYLTERATVVLWREKRIILKRGVELRDEWKEEKTTDVCIEKNELKIDLKIKVTPAAISGGLGLQQRVILEQLLHSVATLEQTVSV